MRYLNRTLFVVILHIVAGLLVSASGLAQEESSFFPARPPTAVLRVVQGTLLDYGVGNKSGGFSIKDRRTGKTLEFYVGWPIRIDGMIVKCSIAPTDSFKPNAKFCTDWPAGIRLGHTTVKVTYWIAEHDGERVNVSDQIAAIAATQNAGKGKEEK
jgi:hypothetical protein